MLNGKWACAGCRVEGVDGGHPWKHPPQSDPGVLLPPWGCAHVQAADQELSVYFTSSSSDVMEEPRPTMTSGVNLKEAIRTQNGRYLNGFT